MADPVRITVDSGRVTVIGEARDGVEVNGTPYAGEIGETVLRSSSESLTVRVPVGTDVVVGTESGDVDLEGQLGSVSVTTSSAAVRAEDVASIDARTVSGKLRVGHSRGPARLTTKSASIRVGRADGEIHISTSSGRIEVAAASAGVAATTVSGRIKLHVDGREPVQVETVSGKITVSIPAGVRPDVRHRTMSGTRRVQPDAGDDLVINARSVSGNITVGVA
jgi:DUF4097 and DUF4098 domain-containing protein YvlB